MFAHPRLSVRGTRPLPLAATASAQARTIRVAPDFSTIQAVIGGGAGATVPPLAAGCWEFSCKRNRVISVCRSLTSERISFGPGQRLERHGISGRGHGPPLQDDVQQACRRFELPRSESRKASDGRRTAGYELA